MKMKGRKSLAIILIAAVVAMIPIGVYAASNVLKKPVIKSVSVSGRQVTVKYNKVKNAKSYAVYRVKTANGKKSYKKVASSKTTTARFMGKYNTKYDLVVKAFKGKKSSKYSAVKSKKIGKSNTYVFFGSDSRWKGSGWDDVKKSGNRGTNGEPRSDVIMLIKVNPGKKTVDLVSISRDTLVNISSSGKNLEKVNRAYAKYGPEGAVKVLEQNLDIEIDGYIASNFKGVADAIDALGGIKLKIEKEAVEDSWKKQYGLKSITQVMNKYIDEQNRIYGENTAHVSSSYTKKAKKLTGSQAVAYARVRYTDGGDMRRTKRQRDVVKKMLSKFKAKSADKKLEVFENIYPSIDTNLSETDLLALLNKVTNYKIDKQMIYPFYKRSAYIKLKEEYQTKGREYVFVPTDTKKNVKELHKLLYGEKVYKTSKKVSSNSSIISKTKVYTKQSGGKVQKTAYKNRIKKWDKAYW